MKKTVAIMLIALSAAGIAVAEEAKAVGPKLGIEFNQRMDAEFVDGVSAQSTTYGTDAVYSRSEIKASAAYTLGDGLTLTPWVKDRFEGRYNPGNLDADPEIEKLGKLRERNRLYLGFDFGWKASDLAQLGFGFEYRLASDLRSDKTGTALPENRITPTVSFKGKAGALSYGIAQSIPFYLDATTGDYDNSSDDLVMELDGTYSLGYSIKLSDAMKLSLGLSDNLIMTMPAASVADTVQPVILNYLSLKACLASGDFAPFVAFFMNSNLDNAGDLANNVMGPGLGASFTKGTLSLSFNYDIGFNMAEGLDARREDHLSVAVKIKG